MTATIANQLDSVPKQIPRSAYLDLLRATGLVLEDVIWLRFGAEIITAEIAARDSSGDHIFNGDEIATHLVVIRVVDDASD